MSKVTSRSRKTTAKGYVLGRRGFAKISAVEGIHMSASMAKEFEKFDREGLSAAERRKAIANKYGKVR